MINHSTTEVFFDNLEVPAWNIIGEEGGGFRVVLQSMNAERTLIAAESIGDCRFFLDRAVAYAKERKVFGKLSLFAYLRRVLFQWCLLALGHPFAVGSRIQIHFLPYRYSIAPDTLRFVLFFVCSVSSILRSTCLVASSRTRDWLESRHPVSDSKGVHGD